MQRAVRKDRATAARRIAAKAKPVPRRDRAIERTRRDILEAAARAFARSGFVRVTMKDIAGEAGYTAASLYSYFESKEEIFAALADLLHEEVMATFEERLPQGLSFAQRLELLLRRQLELGDRRRGAFTIFFGVSEATPLHTVGARSCPALPAERNKTMGAGFDAYVQRLARWIREAGDVGRHDPEDLARALTGISRAFFCEWLLTGGREPLVDRASLVLDLFLYGALGRSPDLVRGGAALERG